MSENNLVLVIQVDRLVTVVRRQRELLERLLTVVERLDARVDVLELEQLCRPHADEEGR
jgi:hypothetical protein